MKKIFNMRKVSQCVRLDEKRLEACTFSPRLLLDVFLGDVKDGRCFCHSGIMIKADEKVQETDEE